ncbi:MAG TPA: ribonuclease H-like domain-containing protein [Thermoplasmata archaeon]
MLKNSFVMLDRVGPQRERTFWKSGVTTWAEFLDAPRIRGISESRKNEMDLELRMASDRLRVHDSSYFAGALPSREQWRTLGDFAGDILHLDIETTGLSLRAPVTVVGVFDGKRMHSLVRGQNLTRSNLQAILSSAGVIVTYNGSTFDIPVLESQFPGVIPRVPHVDLRYPLRRLGFVGGLKKIERELGVERDRRVEYMTGEDAVYLWRLWEREGKVNALELLKEYNGEDCRNLKSLASHVYKNLRRIVFESALRC